MDHMAGRWWLILVAGLAACTANGDSQPVVLSDAAAPEISQGNLPTGVRTEPSGFVSVGTVPPTRFPDEPPPQDPPTESMFQKFARENGYTIEEAMRLINGTPEMMRETERLQRILRDQEADNYVDMRMVRDPAVTMVVTFKRDAEATLRKYTRHPGFRAVEGGRTRAELQPIADRWIKRLGDNNWQYGLSIQPDRGQIELDLGATKAEFDALLAKNGWTVDPEITISYAPPQPPAFTDPALEQLVRIFPRASQSPVIVLSSLTTGTIVLDDGCFRLLGRVSGKPERLVLFGRDVQLTRDDKGYLAFRVAQKPLGRIGELMGWGGYGPARESEPDVIALRKVCGDDEIVSVGVPESMLLFSAPYPAQIDEYARINRMSRRKAWQEITSCLEKYGDARFGGGHTPTPGKDCYGMPISPPPPVEDPASCPEGTTHSFGLCRDEDGEVVPANDR